MLRRTPTLATLAVTLTIVVIACTSPLADVDLYWHVMIGQDILANWRFGGDPSWTLTPAADPNWVTTQWGSEVIMYLLHEAAGWYGLTLLRLAAALSVLAILAPVILRGPGSFNLRAAVFALVGFAVAADVEERPTAFAYVALALVARWAFRVIQDRTWPRLWLIPLLTLVVANLHGYWVLVPAAMGLLVVLLAVDKTPLRELRNPAIAVAISIAAGVATPAGVYGLLAPLTVGGAATPFIIEWARTTIDSTSALALLGLIAMLVVAWTRQREKPVALPVLLWVGVWCAFALIAYRNVLPALMMVAPIAATEITATLKRRKPEVPATAVTLFATVLILVAGVAGAVINLVGEPRIPAHAPTEAFEALRDGKPHRVVTDYNLSGMVLSLAGPDVQVGLDGRTDRYGAEYINEYLGLQKLSPGWQDTLENLDPDRVLIQEKAPLVEKLQDMGWETLVTDNDFVLLAAPGTT